jgi:hypothetical protein
MLITYCEKCGVLIREASDVEEVCLECRKGQVKERNKLRDSSRIDYAGLPSPATILNEVRQTVRRRYLTPMPPA